MKINAIVYCSNAGHTAAYAKLLSEKTGLPSYSLDEAKGNVKTGEKVVFMGWLMGGFVKGYKQAKRRYDTVLTVGVGMTPPSDKERARLANQNKIKFADFRMLLGGYDIKLLSGMYKIMMKFMSKVIKSTIGKKKDATEDEKLMVDMAEKGCYCVSEENLAEVIEAIGA